MNTSPLRAMFWKECRENARWAVLACLALSLGLAYAWFHLFQESSFPVLGQIWSGENLVLTITTPLIGLALGLLQVLPELRRDQWAFLVHRPASRTTLFFGKALAGVCLYLLATILPLLGLAAWAAQPSHVPAPFDFRFTLAGWAAILAGLPFYFAGLLVALRPARWYGSRAMPLLTALFAPFAVTGSNEFWQSALVSLLVLAVLLCAAWGSFLSGGEYKEQAKPARFALGLAFYPAVMAVGLGALVLLVGAYNFLSGTPRGPERWSTDYKIDKQGRIFVVAEHFDGRGHNDKTVTDLAGHAVNPRLWQNLNQQHRLFALNYLFLRVAAGENYQYSDASRYVLNLTTNIADRNQTYWYYETASRRIVCYTVVSQVTSVRGYLGPNGFSQDPARAGRFEPTPPERTYFADLHLLIFPQSLYWYRLPDPASDPAVGLIQTAAGKKSIFGTVTIGGTDGAKATPGKVLAVAADRRITLYAAPKSPGPTLPVLLTTPMAYDVKPGSGIQIAMLPDHSRFFFWYDVWNSPGPNHVVSVDASGHVLGTEDVHSPGPVAASKVPSFLQGLPGLIVPSAAMATSAVYAVIGHALKDETAESWWRGFGFGQMLLSALVFSALGGLVAAIPAWLISRRLGDGRRGQIAWTVGVFWLGGYGVLLLLALRAWPARVPCPNCERPRLVDREQCEHCGAAWARPKRDGTEIFDAAGRAAAVQ